MSLSKVTISNFQSIKSAGLEIGKFTVIVGPSSSGKSAFLRAIKMLLSNARGSSFVTEGEKQTSVSAIFDDVEVEILRGTKNSYTVTAGGDSIDFTKLGGAVPEAVTEALRVEPVKGTHLNFAGQFDRPYLLDDSGSEVARVLGELTNVSILMKASREANRLRLGHSGVLKTRLTDHEILLEEAQRFADLPSRISSAAVARSHLDKASLLDTSIQQISAAVLAVESAQEALTAATAAAATVPVAPVDLLVGVDASRVSLASFASLLRDLEFVDFARDAAEQSLISAIAGEEAANSDVLDARRDRVRSGAAAIANAAEAVLSSQTALASLEELFSATLSESSVAMKEWSTALEQAGHCPMCGADSEDMHLDRVSVGIGASA